MPFGHFKILKSIVLCPLIVFMRFKLVSLDTIFSRSSKTELKSVGAVAWSRLMHSKAKSILNDVVIDILK